jgi:NitT/TauT family transport system ATP-binding protein
MGHIQTENLCREFVNHRKKKGEDGKFLPDEKVSVLEDINIEVEDGEMVCLLGPSGCGKSTLLRIIAGFDKQTSGSILIDGKEITGPSSDNILFSSIAGCCRG